MRPTLLFYDIETSGFNKSFDQVLQFAAIRTDLELNELERHNFFIKLNPDTIPSPEATITHQISLTTLATHGIAEITTIIAIHKLLNTPATISIGYNTLTFDDEFLRFAFHRNLLPPYTHQHNDGCGRIDIFPMSVMYYLFKHDALAWPEIDGTPTLKLEHLSTINNFPQKSAHDAMNDVENTLDLAKLLRNERAMWDYLCGYFNKKIDIERINKLKIEFTQNNEPFRMAILVEGRFGNKNSYQIPVLHLGTHNHYRNQSLWLQLDSPNLATTTKDSIATTTNITRKKYGEPGFILPATSHYMRHLTNERRNLVTTNLLWLQNNAELFKEIVHYHKEYKYPLVPNVDIDAALYQIGFMSDYEKNLCAKFHAAPLATKIKLLDNLKPEIRTQAIRILGRNYRTELPPAIAREFNAYLNTIYASDDTTTPVDYRGEKHLSPQLALQKIACLRDSKILTTAQLNLLAELEQYITSCCALSSSRAR